MAENGTNELSYFLGTDVLCALGDGLEPTWRALQRGETGLSREDVTGGFPCPVARIRQNVPGLPGAAPDFTRFERMSLRVIARALRAADTDPRNPETGLIFCSAKGNIDALYGGPGDYPLGITVRKIARHLGMVTPPLVISNACASGLVGLVTAHRLLLSGRYRRIVVAGCDVLSSFTLLGFQTLQAVSPDICRPYDRDRRGTNLGEAAAAVVIGREMERRPGIRIAGGATTNDAGHISRPRQDGRGLSRCIRAAIRGRRPDFISGHGTGTVFNDEMESAAFQTAGLADLPVHSLKGYLGHTLGACGLLETIICQRALETDTLLPSANFAQGGTRVPLRVIRRLETRPLRSCLKTAAGFGGSNAALYLEKIPA